MADGIKISALGLYTGKHLSDDIPFSGGSPFDTYRWTAGELLNMGRTGLTGGGAANLDGVVSALEDVTQTWMVGAGAVLYPYQLVTGVDAQSLPQVVRPLDFDPANNPKVFKLLTPYGCASTAGLTPPGIMVATAVNTFAIRTIVGASANQVIVTNGSGLAGNPSLSLPQDIDTAAVVQFGRLTLGLTGGNGYLALTSQASVPGTPGGGTRLYSDTNRLAWITTAGFATILDGQAITAARTYTLPDANGTLALTSGTLPSIAGTAGNVLVNGGTAPVTATAITLSLPTALTSINSVRSATATNHTIGTADFGAALTFTSATGAATFAAAILGSGAVAPSSTTTGSNIFTAGIATSGKSFFGNDMMIDGGSTQTIFVSPATVAGNPGIWLHQTAPSATNYAMIGGTNDTYMNSAVTGHLRIVNVDVVSWTSTVVAVAPTTASSSTATGALTVAGGVGIAGKAFHGDTINVTNSSNSFTAATFTSSGASSPFVITEWTLTGVSGPRVTVGVSAASGGVGTSNGFPFLITANGSTVATFTNGTNLTTLSGALTVSGTGQSTFAGNIIQSTAVAGTKLHQVTNTDAGTTSKAAAVVDNGSFTTGVEMPGTGFTTVGPRVASRGYLFSDGSGGFTVHSVNGPLRFWTGNTGTERATITAGVFNLASGTTMTMSDSTSSSSSTTGALVVTGGVGIGGKLFTGDTVTFGGTVTIPSGSVYNSTGTLFLDSAAATSIQFRPAASQKMQLFASGGLALGSSGSDPGAGVFKVEATTASTSTTTGSGVFAGGIGVAGIVWTANAQVNANLRVGDSNALDTTRIISANQTTTVTSGSTRGIESIVSFNPSASSSNVTTAVHGQLAPNTGASGFNITASQSIGQFSGTATGTGGTITAFYGVGAQPDVTGTVTVTSMYAGNFGCSKNSAGSSVTSMYRMNLFRTTWSGSAAGTHYGLNIENVDQGATNYAIKTGTGLVSLGDTTSGTSTTAAAVTAKSLGLTENLLVGGVIAGGITAQSASAWGSVGIQLHIVTGVYTDSSTAGSGTAALATFNSFAAPTLAATNTFVTTTDAATVYIGGGPTQGTNQTITNAWGLWNVGKTRVDGVIVSTDGTGSTSTITGAIRAKSLGLTENLFAASINLSTSGIATLLVRTTSAVQSAIRFDSNNAEKWDIGNSSASNSVNDFFIYDATAASIRLKIAPTTGLVTLAGALSVSDTTASTSTTTGSGIFGGGVGIAGKLYVGGSLDLTGSLLTSASSNTSGTFTSSSASDTRLLVTNTSTGGRGWALITGGQTPTGFSPATGTLAICDTTSGAALVTIQPVLSGSGVAFASSTASTTTATGSITTAGGVGVAGNIYYGGIMGIPNGSATNPSLVLANSTTTGFYRDGSNNIGISVNGTRAGGIYTAGCDFPAMTVTGPFTGTATARTSGTAAYFVVNAPADTGISTATESVGVNFVGAVRTWVDGTVATQREHLIQAPTYNKTTTSATFTKAATFAIAAAPIAGASVTITNAYSLWVQAGLSQFDGVLTAGSTTEATVGAAGSFTSLGGVYVTKKIIGHSTLTLDTYADGTLSIVSGVVTSSSDASLKNLVGDFKRGLADIIQITPQLYTWKPESGILSDVVQAGFIANDVERFIPEAVSRNAAGVRSLNDRPIIAALVNSVRELKSEADELRRQNDDLRRRLDAIAA